MGDHPDSHMNTASLTEPAQYARDKCGLDIALKNCDQSVKDILTQVQREVCNNGTLAGWKSLSELLPQWGLHPQMVSDALDTVKVYQAVRAVDNVNRASKVRMTVKATPSPESLTQIGPKSIGGKAWKSNDLYITLQKSWNGLQSSSLPPCPIWIWIGMIKKVILAEHQDYAGALHMMSTVDYDLDRNPDTKFGFDYTWDVSAKCVASGENCLRGAALAALFSFDIQNIVRETQETWLVEQKGAYSLGADNISPRDWVAAAVGDCAGLSPFGYLSSLGYARGKVSMFLAMALANSHDVLYDICSQNRMSSVLYAAAAGGAMQDMHTVFLHTIMDAVAGRVSGLREGEQPLYGDSAALCTAAWVPFNGRYRTWERFVKYHRLLFEAQDPDYSIVLDHSVRQIVFKDYNIDTDDVVSLWQAAIDEHNNRPTKSRKRKLIIYPVELAFDCMVDTSYIGRPTLCSQCSEAFSRHTTHSHPELHTTIALDLAALECPAVIWAATIAFFSRWATGESCCDNCAIKIGIWADEFSYIILVELMKSEQASNAREWLLHQYAVWCTAAAPVSVATVLSGFDLRADIRADAGAMGHRDTVDC